MRGDTVQIRLVGVNADNRADGKGKAGLTFMSTTYVSEIGTNMADTNNNAGGYRDVRIRKDYNKNQYKSTISSNVYQYLTPVLKTQDNQANSEMNNDGHSATSNAIVEKVSMPSPLELNMNVTQWTTSTSYNGLTPTGMKQYSGNKNWYIYYNYLYSGNASYKYYQNNVSNIREYCKLIKGSGLYKDSWASCQNIPEDIKRVWLRAPGSVTSNDFANFYYNGSLNYDYASILKNSRAVVLFSF